MEAKDLPLPQPDSLPKGLGGNTTLHYLFSSNWFTAEPQSAALLTRRLLSMGALTNHRNYENSRFNYQYTPLHMAVKSKQIEAVKLAIDINMENAEDKPVFDFTIPGKQGWTVVHMAAYF